jgi:hypothetical protein
VQIDVECEPRVEKTRPPQHGGHEPGGPVLGTGEGVHELVEDDDGEGARELELLDSRPQRLAGELQAQASRDDPWKNPHRELPAVLSLDDTPDGVHGYRAAGSAAHEDDPSAADRPA